MLNGEVKMKMKRRSNRWNRKELYVRMLACAHELFSPTSPLVTAFSFHFMGQFSFSFRKVPRLIEGTTIWAAPVKQEAGPGGGGAALSGDCDWVCARTLPPSPDRQQFGIYRQSWKSALHKDTHWPYELLYLPTKTEDGVLLLELEDDVIARANDAILPAGTRVRISHPAMDG